MEHPTKTYDEGGLDLPDDNFLPGTGILVPHVFLGDEGFSLGRHLMRPFRRLTAEGENAIFNYRLSRARRVVENAFGILTTRWRILENKLDLTVVNVNEVVKACVALHNYLKATDATDHAAPRYIPEHYVDYESELGEIVEGNWRKNVDHTYALLPLDEYPDPKRASYSIRRKFANYFTTDNGAVPWQRDVITRGHY